MSTGGGPAPARAVPPKAWHGVHKALADPLRIRLVEWLMERPRSAGAGRLRRPARRPSLLPPRPARAGGADSPAWSAGRLHARGILADISHLNTTGYRHRIALLRAAASA